jgi:hypothetical protein
MEVIQTNLESLGAIYRQIQKGLIRIPAWQRDDVWTDATRKKWFETIRQARGGEVFPG